MINPMDLSRKHIIITGGSSGIGRAAAIQASKLGARVSLVARDEKRLNETIEMLDGSGHNRYIFDLNNINEISTLIKTIVDVNGPIDGLVHAAGIGFNRPLKLTKPDFIVENFSIHFIAFSELIRSAAAKKYSNDGASYLGISSVASIRGNKAQGAYAAAKGAMNAVIHPYAKELAPKGIRVNTIAFGMVETEIYKTFLESGGNNEELLNEQCFGVIPVEYAGNAICYMLSDAARYITGSVFIYDGGVLA